MSTWFRPGWTDMHDWTQSTEENGQLWQAGKGGDRGCG